MIRHRRFRVLFILAIASAPAEAHGVEALILSALIYGIGVGIAGGLVNGVVRKNILLGLIVTMAFYFLAGLGFAAFDILTGQPIPTQARLRSLMAHTVFGIGLYARALLLSQFLQAHA